jgi:hypothetical protein
VNRALVRVAAICATFAMATNVVRAAEPVATPVCEIAAPAPEKAAPLVWKNGGSQTSGLFLTDEQTKRVTARIYFLEDSLTQAKVNEAKATAQVSIPSWVWVASGIVVGGAIGYMSGFAVGKLK